MAQYSKKKFDGTVVHYESREEMDAASDRTAIFWISVISFIVGAVAAYVALSSLDVAWLPDWAKFVTVLASAICSSYVGWKLGKVILLGIGLILLLLFLFGVGSVVWSLATSA